jgi:hypothetical protein
MPTQNPDSTWYWPEHGLVEDDTLRIFAAKFRSDPGGPPGFQFAHAGNDIVNFSYPGLEYINSVEISASAVNDVLYGDRILEDASYVYIYGRRNDDPGINIPYPHVARAPKGKLMDQNWEFFTANGWSDDPMDTRRMHSFPVSQQYSVSRYRDKYIMLTQDIWLSPKIFTFTSDSPSGPWINQRLIYETPETEGDTWTYNAYAHPQFDRNAELLVSYNVNGDFFSIFNNVEIYRPRFIRVPYMNIDFAFWPTGRDEVKSESAVNIILYPNPVNHELGIHIRVDQSQHARIEILDIGGVLRYTGSHHLMYGDNRFTINAEDLSPGMYFLKIQGREEGGRVKFVKK